MSLRTFHLFFISISALLCLFLLLWGIWDFKTSGSSVGIGLAIFGLVGLVLLVQYFRWFRQKYFKVLPLILGFLLCQFGFVDWARACSVCYGNPDSSLTKGAVMGVWILAAVVVMVLSLIVVVARSWMKRAKELLIPL